MNKWICNGSRLLIVLLIATSLISCLSKPTSETNGLGSQSSSNGKYVVPYDPPPMVKAEKRKLAGNSSAICDLGKDRCKADPLTEAEANKTFFLTDLVAEKIKALEIQEKAAGRELNVVLLSRQGSNLAAFQPLIDVDEAGNPLTTDQIGQAILKESGKSVLGKLKKAVPFVSNSRMKMLRKHFDRSRAMKYSHLGIAVRNMDLKDEKGNIVTSRENGQWAVVQLLYTCQGGNISKVFKGTLSNFFYDHMHGYGAHLLVPSQDLQKNIEQIVVKDYLGKNWIEKQYNALALPNDLNQQNSNQYVLEVIAAALYPSGVVKDRAQAQQILRDTKYRSTKLTPDKFLYRSIKAKGVGSMMSSMMPVMCMNRQPEIHKYGIGEVISELSVKEYLTNLGRLQAEYEIEINKQDQDELDGKIGLQNDQENTDQSGPEENNGQSQ